MTTLQLAHEIAERGDYCSPERAQRLANEVIRLTTEKKNLTELCNIWSEKALTIKVELIAAQKELAEYRE